MDASLPGPRPGPGGEPGERDPHTVPAGPPFDLDVLADLHAGVFGDEVAAVLRARVAADPDSAAVLQALDATVADLHALPAAVPIPRQVATRLDAVIAAESAARARATNASGGSPAGVAGPVSGTTGAPPAAPLAFVAPPRQVSSPPSAPSPPTTPSPTPPPSPGGTVSSLDHARRARQSRNLTQRRWAIGLGAAAAVAAVFAIGAVVVNPGGTPGSGLAGDLSSVTTSAQPTTGTGPTTGTDTGTDATQGEPAPGQAATQVPPAQTQAVVATPHHLADLLPQIDGKAPAGPFADRDRLQACLAANDASGDEVLGVLPVSYTGQSAYAISLRAPDGTLRILVVGGACGQSGADLKEEQTTHG